MARRGGLVQSSGLGERDVHGTLGRLLPLDVVTTLRLNAGRHGNHNGNGRQETKSRVPAHGLPHERTFPTGKE
jgi:hypothetical protein